MLELIYMSITLQTSVQGLQGAANRVAKAADNVANVDTRPNVSLDEELVNAVKAKQDYAANAEVIRTEKELQEALRGTLFDKEV